MKQSKFLYFFYDREHFRRFLWGIIFLTFFTAIGAIFVPQAWAQANNFSCDTGTATGNLFMQDTVTNTLRDSGGNAYNVPLTNTNKPDNANPFTAAGMCPASLGTFARVLCFFKSTVGQVVSTIYCQFQYSLQGPLSVAIELFIVITGIAILTGLTRLTPREGIKILLKIALVWTFATNATWGIGIAYSFFVGLAEQGSNIVLNTIGNTHAGVATAVGDAGYQQFSGGASLSKPDQVISAIVGIGAGDGTFLPKTLTSYCVSVLIGLLILLLLFLPWVAGLVFALIIQYLWIYIRALLGYLTALVLISFLFVLSPLFISFALFKVTYPMFEQWLKYLTSFSLQMVIIFSFIAMMTMVPMGAFFTEILGLIRPYDDNMIINGLDIKGHFCSICEHTVNTNPNPTPANPMPTIVTCTSDKAIPLMKLFTAKSLAEAIVAQAIALWLVGMVIQDFMKQAPELARLLTSKLHFAASLSGSTEGNSFSPAIEYVGLNKVEAALDSFTHKLTSSDGYKGNWWMRAGPALAVGAGGLALKNKIQKDEAQMQSQNTGGANYPEVAVASAATQKLAASSVDAQYLKVHQDMDKYRSKTEKALTELEKLKKTGADKKKIEEAKRNLQQTNDAYMKHTSLLYNSPEKLAQGGTGPLNSARSFNIMRAQTDDIITSLQMNAKVRAELQPAQPVLYAQELQQVKQAADNAKTTDEMQKILQQLKETKKTII